MPERFGAGEWPEPAALPDHLKRLHKRIQKAAAADRSKRAQVKAKDVDETGRIWPGLVTPRKPNP
jgi:hypothetical protein